MHKASSAASHLPSETLDVQAIQSSALAAATDVPDTQREDVLSMLDKLPLGHERRQLDDLTRFLTEVNKVAKRDAIIPRQLGLIKSAPEALSQLAKIAKGLPIKRDEGEGFYDIGGIGHFLSHITKRTNNDGSFDDIGGIGHFLSHITKREEKGGIDGLSGVSDALDGLAKRELDDLAKRSSTGPTASLGGLKKLLGGLAKRDEDEENSDNEHYVKHGETMLKNLNGMFGKADKYKGEQFQGTPKAEKPYGLGQLAKRQLRGLAGATDLLKALAKRDERLDEMEEIESLDGFPGSGDALRAVELLQRAYEDYMMQERDSDKGIGGLGSIGGVDPMATPALPLDATELHDTSNEDDLTGPEEIEKEVEKGEKIADEATKKAGFNSGLAKGPLGKRQVPPIAGPDLPTIVKAIAANPSMAVAPLTQGVKIAGTNLGDFFKK